VQLRQRLRATLIRQHFNAARSTDKRPNTAALGILHHNPDPRAFGPAPIILDDVRDSCPPTASLLTLTQHELLKKRDFLLNISDIVVCRVEVDDLESHDMAGLNVPTLVDGPVSALSSYLEFLKGVRLYQGFTDESPTSYNRSGFTSLGCATSELT
jgi:hypothetical protein